MLITEKSSVDILAYSLPYGGLRPGPSGECTDSGYFVETLLRSSSRSLRPPKHGRAHSKHQRGREIGTDTHNLLRPNVLVAQRVGSWRPVPRCNQLRQRG